MLYVLFNENGCAVAAYTRDQMDADYGQEKARALRTSDAWKTRNDWNSLEEVTRIAEQLTTVTGRLHLGTDAGDCVSPRYDVILAPAVGDPVSYAFNGDYTPCGHITKVSAAATGLRRVETDDGSVFYRRGNSGTWKKAGGTWSMVAGHIRERNPHF